MLEPIHTFEYIPRPYWKCTIKEHRHKTRDTAFACLVQAHDRKPDNVRIKRDRHIFTDCLNGKTYKVIAASINLSKAWVEDIIKKEIFSLDFFLRMTDKEALENLQKICRSVKDMRANKEWVLSHYKNMCNCHDKNTPTKGLAT